MATTNLAPHGYDQERGRDFYHQLLGRVRALSGVEDAGLSRVVLLTGVHSGTTLETAKTEGAKAGR